MDESLTKDSVFGPLRGMMCDDDGELTVSILCDEFEEDNERYPTYKLFDLFEDWLLGYTNPPKDPSNLDPAPIQVFRKFVEQCDALIREFKVEEDS